MDEVDKKDEVDKVKMDGVTRGTSNIKALIFVPVPVPE